MEITSKSSPSASFSTLSTVWVGVSSGPESVRLISLPALVCTLMCEPPTSMVSTTSLAPALAAFVPSAILVLPATLTPEQDECGQHRSPWLPLVWSHNLTRKVCNFSLRRLSARNHPPSLGVDPAVRRAEAGHGLRRPPASRLVNRGPGLGPGHRTDDAPGGPGPARPREQLRVAVP